MRYITWPNALSVLRLPLAAAFVATDSTPARGVILAVGAVSDWVDGWFARRLKQTTRVGEVLDPIADRVFAIAVLGTFLAEGRLALWELLLLLARDIYTTAAFVAAQLLRLPVRFRARRSGKIVTTLQVITAFVVLLRPEWIEGFAIGVGAVALYAIVDYTRAGLDALHRADVPP